MPWTETTRREYERHGWRYASDMTDAEWVLIAPFMPARKGTGRSRTTELRAVCDAILYMAATGCQWAMIPKDFPPPSAVERWYSFPEFGGYLGNVGLISKVTTPLFLGMVFFLVLTPIGLFMKIFGKDAMQRKIDDTINTYRVASKDST